MNHLAIVNILLLFQLLKKYYIKNGSFQFTICFLYCNWLQGNHSFEKITIFGHYKYRVKEFYEVTCCYVKERMDICSYCKKCLDCKKVSNITFAFDSIYKKNKEKEDCISHAVINWHCFKHAFCRICVDTAGTNLCCIHKNDKEQNPRQKWLYKKEKMGLIQI